jgi:pyruvate formate lyase activating enzyme
MTRTEISIAQNNSVQGLITDIKRFAVHDGPGVRTTIFLKGCVLHCGWCHNPETINLKAELMLYLEQCIGCGACFTVCPTGAHEMTEDGHVLHRELCAGCGRCVEECYAGALKMVGNKTSVADLMEIIRQDIPFYQVSGGGVTLSGGEPLVQPKFTKKLLQQCKEEHIHTALDTSGSVPWRVLETVLPYVDLVLYDLKHISPSRHRKYTGASNHLILENMKRLADCRVPVEIRMLIIPTINDSWSFISRAAKFLESLDNITAVRLLAYHHLAGSKYRRLDKVDTLPNVASPTDDQLQRIAGWIQRYDLKVVW